MVLSLPLYIYTCKCIVKYSIHFNGNGRHGELQKPNGGEASSTGIYKGKTNEYFYCRGTIEYLVGLVGRWRKWVAKKCLL